MCPAGVPPHLVMEFAQIPLHTYPEILKSSLACRYFLGSRNYNSTFNLPGVTKVMPAATSRAFAPIQCIRKKLRQMNATLVTFPGISSFECLTASPLNKFSRSVEQAPAMLQITLRVTYLWRIRHRARIYHRIYNHSNLRARIFVRSRVTC